MDTYIGNPDYWEGMALPEGAGEHYVPPDPSLLSQEAWTARTGMDPSSGTTSALYGDYIQQGGIPRQYSQGLDPAFLDYATNRFGPGFANDYETAQMIIGPRAGTSGPQGYAAGEQDRIAAVLSKYDPSFLTQFGTQSEAWLQNIKAQVKADKAAQWQGGLQAFSVMAPMLGGLFAAPAASAVGAGAAEAGAGASMFGDVAMGAGVGAAGSTPLSFGGLWNTGFSPGSSLGLEGAAATAVDKTLQSAIMGGVTSGTQGGDWLSGATSGALKSLTGNAGSLLGGLGSTTGINSLSGDQPWGVNPQDAGGSMDDFDLTGMDGAQWGDYTNQMGTDFFGGGGGDLFSSDVPQGYSVDGMGGTGAPLPDAGGGDINWGGIAQQSLPMILKMLGLGGGGTATGGTTGGTTGAGGAGGTAGGGAGATNLGLLGGGIYDYNSLNRSSDFLRQIMQQASSSADPYAARRSQMGADFDQLMRDPMSSNLVRSLDQSFQNEYDARGAQAGTYNTAYDTTERESQRMANIVKNLPQLAQPFGQASGAYSNPAQAGAIMAEMSKPITAIEQAKARAVGQATSGGIDMAQQSLPELLKLLGINMGTI